MSRFEEKPWYLQLCSYLNIIYKFCQQNSLIYRDILILICSIFISNKDDIYVRRKQNSADSVNLFTHIYEKNVYIKFLLLSVCVCQATVFNMLFGCPMTQLSCCSSASGCSSIFGSLSSSCCFSVAGCSTVSILIISVCSAVFFCPLVYHCSSVTGSLIYVQLSLTISQ